MKAVKASVKALVLLVLLVSIIMLIKGIDRVNAMDNTFIIPPAQDIRITINLDNSSGIDGNFFALNGSVNFAFLDPNGMMLYGSDRTSNGTINYSASKTGNYVLQFSNPSLTEAVLVRLKYSVKSWHSFSVWKFSIETPSPFPWASILFVLIVVMNLLIEILNHLNDFKPIVMKPLVKYNKPKLPLETKPT